MKVNDKDLLVKGAVLAVLADTQAAHSLGGFKVGVGFSLRRCRNCLATKESYTNQVRMYSVCVCVYTVFTWLDAVEFIRLVQKINAATIQGRHLMHKY